MVKSKKYFKKVDPKQNFPELEEQIIKYWEKNSIEKKHLERNKDGKAYVFYDGPPTANGKPHIGHVITRAFKDFFPRYKTMRGYHVVRKAGWDTHGLPVEVAVEKELGVNSKEEIENLVPNDKTASIKKFNELCRENVWKYIELWEKMVKRVGHFIDMKDPYVTYNRDYVESVWWGLSKLFEKDLLYSGYKVIPYCTRCETPLSSHELAQDYKEVTDNSIYVKFPLKNNPEIKLVAWTTTPWTLPGHVALAVDPKMTYVEVNLDNSKEKLILAREAAKRLKLEVKNAKEIEGEELIGKQYSPPYPFLADKFKDNKNLHRVVKADFVAADEGSGIVHTAVMYGADDFELGKSLDLPMYHLVDERGRFKKEVKGFAGQHVHEANPKITEDLKQKELLWKEEKIKHQYPFCWRCHNPLIYYALESWFIKTTDFKDKLQKNNAKVNWVPRHVGKGRMRNWYETLVDWSLSRNRYWGTPLPIWICQGCDNKRAIGSLKELKDAAITKHDWENFDLHRPWVDEVELKCDKCGQIMKRTPEVIDVWYDSGSMPFAQWHSPHEHKNRFKDQFPADFISEAIDQTRGWFFSLQAISTMLFSQTPYKNAVVFEHALDPKGKKMSKHIGNVLDPWKAFEQHGADATRWFFLSAVPVGTPYRVSLETIAKHSRNFITPFWNSYNFFVTYANLNEWRPNEQKKISLQSNNILDSWIIARLNKTINQVSLFLDKYDTYKAAEQLASFIQDYSNWFVRLSRDRLGIWVENQKDKNSFFETSYFCLIQISKMTAPYMPFISEEIYHNLTGEESVHLSVWPEDSKVDEKLLEDMAFAREIVEKGHSVRKNKQIPVRQPLSELIVKSDKSELSSDIMELVLQELNIKKICWQKSTSLKVELNTEITPELKEEANTRKLIRDIQIERKKQNISLTDRVEVTSPWLPKDPKLIKWLKEKTGSKRLTRGEFSVKLPS